MKRLFAILVAILAVTSVAFAAAPALPDYQKDGRSAYSYLCDADKTTIKNYAHKDWNILELRAASGDVFVDMASKNGFGLFMQLAGFKEMKKVTHKEWDEALTKSALNAYNDLHGNPNDCKQQ
ncbi:MAG: hypothetical protein WAP51_01540 [Candidatus Sungiibacteriota bacterium]